MIINNYNIVIGSKFQTKEGYLLTMEYRNLDTNICKKTKTIFIYDESKKNYLNLTYDEFISQFDETDRMMLPTEEAKELQPSEALKRFIDKWL